jgi:hypothetical protein
MNGAISPFHIYFNNLINQREKSALIFYSVFFHQDLTLRLSFKGRSSNEGKWIKALRSIFVLVKEEAAEELDNHVIWNFIIGFIQNRFRVITSRGSNG